MAVTTSKKVVPSGAFARTCPATRAALSSAISLPLTLNRSVKRVRWGEVKSPARYPPSARMEARKAAVDPLPLVPATWTTLSRSWGLPSRWRRVAIRSSPGLMPKRRRP